MSTDIIPYSDIERMAGAMVTSGLFGLQKTEQAVALMLVAQAEGLHPATVAVDYDFIQGKPTKKPTAMLRDFIKRGGKVQWHAMDDTVADATFSHPQGGTVRVRWDMEKAKQAQLAGKDMWKKYPAAMLRSRCVSEGMRAVFPAATGGLYTPEEVQDFEPAAPARTAPIDVTPRDNGSTVDHSTGEIIDQPRSAPRSAGNASRATDKQIKLIRVKLGQAKISDEEACEQYGLDSLTELPFDGVNEMLAWISKHSEARAD